MSASTGRAGAMRSRVPSRTGPNARPSAPTQGSESPSRGSFTAPQPSDTRTAARRNGFPPKESFSRRTPMFADDSRSKHEAGQTLPLIVVFMLVLMVVCGMVLDIGNAYRVKTALQASADAAAAAGAQQLPNTGTALSTVQQYGSEPGGKNP